MTMEGRWLSCRLILEKRGNEMDKILYSQVLITCTTINVISIISMFGVIIADKLHDHREKKKKEREEKAAKDAEIKAD
jgi:hypothetical protein